MNIKDIDITFDFTTDTKGFWDGFGRGMMGLEPEVLIQIQRVRRLDYTVNFFGASHCLMVR